MGSDRIGGGEGGCPAECGEGTSCLVSPADVVAFFCGPSLVGQDGDQLVVARVEPGAVLAVERLVELFQLLLFFLLLERLVELLGILDDHLTLLLELLLVFFELILRHFVPLLDHHLFILLALVQRLLQLVSAVRVQIKHFREPDVLSANRQAMALRHPRRVQTQHRTSSQTKSDSNSQIPE